METPSKPPRTRRKVLKGKDACDFLDKLYEQDISDSLRQALQEHPQVSLEDNGQGKVISATVQGKTYSFKRNPDKEADAPWFMTATDQSGTELYTTELEEEADEAFLEKLFNNPTEEEQIAAIRDNL